jgi:hypothetical protein
MASPSNDPELLRTIDSAIHILQDSVGCRQPFGSSDQPEEVDANIIQHDIQQQSVPPRLFLPLQRHMLDDLVRHQSSMLWQLDPSRDDQAEMTYISCRRLFLAGRDEIRFSHGDISGCFLHGDHRGQPCDKLEQELVDRQKRAEDLPSLVGISYRGTFWVICGNRRLNAYKQSALRIHSEVWFRMIVHDFPQCPTISDAKVRAAFWLKTIQAMTTVRDCPMRKQRFQRCLYRPRRCPTA